MPKGFTDNERIKIEKELFNTGRTLFIEHGFKKTSVSKITDAVGIAKGSFYLFYDSKEELFIDILERIEDVIQNEIIEEIEASTLPAPQLFKSILRTRLRSATNDPIIQMTLQGDVIQRIWSKLPESRKKANIEKDARFIEKFILARPDAVVMFEHDSEKLAGVFRSLFFLILHKVEIGEHVFEDVLDFMVDASVDKLFRK